MDVRTIIRYAIPNASDEVCEWIIWDRTAYPFVPLTAKEIYKAAARVQRATNGKKQLCDLCDRLAEPKMGLCKKCREALNKAQSDDRTSPETARV